MPAYDVQYTRNNEECLRCTIIYLEPAERNTTTQLIGDLLKKLSASYPGFTLHILDITQLIETVEPEQEPESPTPIEKDSDDGIWDFEML